MELPPFLDSAGYADNEALGVGAFHPTEDRFRNIIVHSPDLIFVNRDGRVIYVNPAGVRLLKAESASQLLGRSPLELFHSSQHEQILERIALLRQAPCSVPVVQETMLALDGSELQVEVFACSYLSGDQLDIQVVCRDVTERQANEERLRRQAALLDQASDAIIVRDLERRIQYWNRGAERLYGWTAEEAIGVDIEKLLQTSDGVSDEATRVAFDVGEWMGERAQKTKEGQPLTVLGRWTVLTDKAGEPESVLVINTDITEVKKLEQQFLRAQRLESIGRLAGGIAHDLNNVLTPILMSTELLETEIATQDGKSTLSLVRSSALRGAELIKQVLGFARGVQGEVLPVDPLEIARDIHKIVSDTFPKNITVSLTKSDELWNVLADPTQLHQVLMNLCVNSRDAMPDGGHLTLAFQNLVLDDLFERMEDQAKQGPYVLVRVEDTGQGMSRAVMDRIFEPFFTTKELGEGTGLGMSTVHSIVSSFGGFINVYSELGKGTRFKIYLPAITEFQQPRVGTSSECQWPRGNGELILLVDDEESICKVARRALEAFGYRVILAANGAEGVSLFVQFREEIDVVLTDMNMPVMDGPAMMVALKSIDPKVRIIGSSGLSSGDGLSKALAIGVEHFVPKPYTAELLLTCLRKVLSGGGGEVEPSSSTNKGARAERGSQSQQEGDFEGSVRGCTVLFVDDEPNLLRLGRAILESAGYAVLCAESGTEALEILDLNLASVELLVTDMTMPGLNGRELAEEAVRRLPNLRVVYSSGSSWPREYETDNKVAPAGYLTKPYSVRELKEIVSKALADQTEATEG